VLLTGHHAMKAYWEVEVLAPSRNKFPTIYGTRIYCGVYRGTPLVPILSYIQ